MSDYRNLEMIDTIRVYEFNDLRRIRLIDKCAMYVTSASFTPANNETMLAYRIVFKPSD